MMQQTPATTPKTAQAIVKTTGRGSVASTAATVVPFQKGSPTTSKQVGDIPPSYTEGVGNDPKWNDSNEGG